MGWARHWPFLFFRMANSMTAAFESSMICSFPLEDSAKIATSFVSLTLQYMRLAFLPASQACKLMAACILAFSLLDKIKKFVLSALFMNLANFPRFISRSISGLVASIASGDMELRKRIYFISESCLAALVL